MSLTDALFLDPTRTTSFWHGGRTVVAGSGTITDPLSANTPERFDQLLNSFTDPMTVVHL